MSNNSRIAKNITRSTRNLILNSLPDENFARLLPDLEQVHLTLGQVIFRAEEPIEYVYFPNNSMISVIANTVNGQSAEVGVIGYEGIIGIDVLMGSNMTLNDNIIQLANSALRIKTAAVQKEFKRADAFHDSVLRFIRLMMIQISQTALCNRLHSVEERLARWLLMCHDRSPTDNLNLTQEFLAVMLGSNRATVTLSALTLQNIGYIKYSRGRITITDRPGLESFACDCYQTVKTEYDRSQSRAKLFTKRN
ncbi:MAG: Crp/Fnr family transcriptional regulator [Pyrinomonadaceae bacterium]